MINEQYLQLNVLLNELFHSHKSKVFKIYFENDLGDLQLSVFGCIKSKTI